MKLKVSTQIALIFVFIVIIFFGLVLRNSKFKNQADVFNYKTRTLLINEVKITAEVADTPAKQELGLGNRKSLGERSGMLFPYSSKTIPYFWMKGMLIPIDIIWIADDKIVKIDKNVPNLPTDTPESQLPTYFPQVPVNLVLEVNAGFSEENDLEVGDQIKTE